MSFKWNCADFLLYPPNYPLDKHCVHPNTKQERHLVALIIANCDVSTTITQLWERSQLHICADGGANRLFNTVDDKSKWVPGYIKGDLDSVTAEVLQFYKDKGTAIVYDHSQDSTDLEKCLSLLEEHEREKQIKFSTIVVAGGLGGSFTHEIANCNALYRICKYKSRHIVLWSETNAAWLLDKGSHEILTTKDTKCGILPIGSKCSITTTGLKWDLTNGELEYGVLVSTSNLTVSSKITIDVSCPVLWTIDFIN